MNQIYPAQKEDSLKIISSEFLVKHLNEENVYTYLEYAKKKKADGHIQKCLDFIQNQAGIKFVTADSLLSIEITEPKIPLEEVSKQITALIKIYEGNVAITFKPKISGNMEAFKGFIEQQGPFIHSLDLQELGDSVDDDAMEKWIKSCPNLKSVIIRSNNITGRGLEELGSLANLTTLDLSGCKSLTKLPSKLPDTLTTLDLSGCKRLTKLPSELPATLTMLDISMCTSLTKLPALPATLTTLEIACTNLTKLPALPATLTTFRLAGCDGLTELPELPATLTKLDFTWCTSLTKLPALPATLTTLILSRCTSLTKLPALPATLTFLGISGCGSLTDESRLNALSSLLEANLEQGFKLIDRFAIQNQDSLFKLLGEKLNGKPIMEGQDYRVVLVEALEKKISDQTIAPSTLISLAQFIYDNQVSLHLHDEHPLMQEAIVGALEKKLADQTISPSTLMALAQFIYANKASLKLHDEHPLMQEAIVGALAKKLSDQTISPSTLMALAQFIYDNQVSLHLHDEHPLMQEAIGIIFIASVEGGKNPFSLFKRLTELFQKPSDFNPPAMDVEGALVAINRAQLMAMGWEKIKREDLPQNVTRKAFDYLTTALREKVRANSQKAEKALDDLSIKWATIETPIFGDPKQHLAGMLDLAGENVSDTEAKWRAVLSNIFDKNHTERMGNFFTEREETFILTIMGIQNCEGGKDAGIALSYEQLDPEYHYQRTLSKPMSIAEKESEEKRGAAIQLVKEFESSALEKLDMESPKQASEAEKLAAFLNENFKDNSIVLTPIFGNQDCWNWDDNFINISVSEKGALTLLELVKKEDLNQVVEQTIQKLIAAQFSGTNPLTQELTGEKEIKQGAHQAIYLKNLIGHLVGVSGGVAFDRHTGTLYDALIAKDREEVLSIFFKHVTPKSFVDEIVRVVNSQQIKFGTLSRQGAIDLLKQLHYLS